jgi:hypothetical protein
VQLDLVGNHPYFGDLANRLPYMEATPGREFIVVIDDELFKQIESEAQRRHLEQQRRLLRPDPRGMPIIQAGRTLPYLAIIAGVSAAPLILTAAAPLIASAGATAAVTTGTTVTTAATTAPAVTAATTAPAVTASSIVVPATIAARVAPAVTAAVTSTPAITAPAITWGAAKFTSAAAVVAILTTQGMTKAHANTVAEAIKPYMDKPALAMADVTTNAELANAKPGQAISLNGQIFRAIIRLKTPD